MRVKVRLEDGTQEKFDRGKIVESLETVGLDRHTSKMIADQIIPHEGMTEHEIKVKVFRILDDIDPRFSDKYLRTKKVYIQKEQMDVIGNALLPRVVMEYLDLRNGEKVDIIHCEKNCTLKAFQIDDPEHAHDRVVVSHYDMDRMGLKPRSQIAICKHMDP